MAIVGEPFNVDAHAKIPSLLKTVLWCTHVPYTLTVTVQLSCNQRSEHRTYPGDTTHHTHITHTLHITQKKVNFALRFPNSKYV